MPACPKELFQFNECKQYLYLFTKERCTIKRVQNNILKILKNQMQRISFIHNSYDRIIRKLFDARKIYMTVIQRIYVYT